MLIEADARRFITNAVEIEKELISMEMKEKSKGKFFLDSEEYNTSRKKLIKVIGQINSVANSEGNGRDDLDIDILVASERLIRNVYENQGILSRSRGLEEIERHPSSILHYQIKSELYPCWLLYKASRSSRPL